MTNNLCRYNKFGYCKFGNECRFRHNNVMCGNKNCNVFDCEKRHPVIYKYFRNFKKYKFDPCAYRHENVSDVNDLDDKVTKIEKIIGVLEKNQSGNVLRKY